MVWVTVYVCHKIRVIGVFSTSNIAGIDGCSLLKERGRDGWMDGCEYEECVNRTYVRFKAYFARGLFSLFSKKKRSWGANYFPS